MADLFDTETPEMHAQIPPGMQFSRGVNGEPGYYDPRNPINSFRPFPKAAPAAPAAAASTGADAQTVIRQWQQSHGPHEPLDGLIAELKRNGIDADAFMYGATPSGNEIRLNGQQYKVKTGDNASWWDPSMGEGGGDDWFAANLPAPEPYTALGRPEGLQQPFVAPTFTAPTQEELQGSPGYLASEKAMQRGLERSAAAQGSVLSGGFVGRALPRALGEHAADAYNNLYGQRYQAFSGNSANAFGARQANEGAYQADVGNNLNQYQARYQAYRGAIGDNQYTADMGLRAALGSRP